jgi:hypothetical protein
LRAGIFRSRVFSLRSRRIARDRAARTQLQHVPSRRLSSPGGVARTKLTPNGGCELQPFPRFCWAKAWHSIDGNIADTSRKCSRADSHRAVWPRRPIASIGDYRTAVAHSRRLVFRFFGCIVLTTQSHDQIVSRHVAGLRFGY